MRLKLENWMYAALILGLIQLAEFLYNRIGVKLAGQIVAIAAILLAFIWIGSLGYKLAFRTTGR